MCGFFSQSSEVVRSSDNPEPVPRKVEHKTFQKPCGMTVTSIQEEDVAAGEEVVVVVVAEEEAVGEDGEGVEAVATAQTVWDHL